MFNMISVVLGSSVSFVTSGSFSTTGSGIGGPSYEAPLHVVIALASFLGFGMVLLGNELDLEAWIIPGPAGLVQRAKLLKENVFILDPDGALMSTQEYMQKVVEDVGEDADFNSGAWGKLDHVVAIVKSCSSNALGEDLNVTLKIYQLRPETAILVAGICFCSSESEVCKKC
ncbi:hypothetical protein Tco_0079446 [Tanacetum coccineum]